MCGIGADQYLSAEDSLGAELAEGIDRGDHLHVGGGALRVIRVTTEHGGACSQIHHVHDHVTPELGIAHALGQQRCDAGILDGVGGRIHGFSREGQRGGA